MASRPPGSEGRARRPAGGATTHPHALLAELAGGGIAKEINASDVDRFLEAITPGTPVEQVRYDLAVELLDDIRRLDTQLKTSHKRIRDAVRASATSATDLFGVGPIIVPCLGREGDLPPAHVLLGLTEPLDLRWVVVHLIEETAHHAGHADSTRELLDGKEMRAGATVKRERVVAAGVLCTRPGPLA